LTTGGNYPTRCLFDHRRLAQLEPGALLVNAARGGVVNADALLAELETGRLHAALDVWPDEPLIATGLLDAACVATPHVAGYSAEGKQAGTRMIYHAFCKALSLQPVVPSAPAQANIKPVFSATMTAFERLKLAIQTACPVSRDDAALRVECRLHPKNGQVHIDRLRANYPARHEFRAYHLPACADPDLTELGFQLY